MQRYLLLSAVLFAVASPAFGHGLLIPTEPDLPPLAMLNHHVDVTLEDQVAVTKVEQTFRNHTDRQLEATYVFPVPAGASVREFAMWVDGRRVKGELLTADEAKTMYTNIVRQTKNPALLDYIGSDLLSLKVFPVPAGGEQKLEVSFTAVARKQLDVVEYVYPLQSDRAAASTLEEFRLSLQLKSKQPIGNIYSPTHDVAVHRSGDHEALVRFEQQGATLDRDFHLFYTTSGQDIGLTALTHRPISSEDGYVMLLVSPRAELSKEQKVPRDIVFVVDTSGSMMQDNKMEQARKALKHCLGQLTAEDRFSLISFASTVESYRDALVPADEEHVKQAQGWVSDLYAGGGTAIDRALKLALSRRSDDPGRMFTVVFFTDGQPTIGERDTDKILANVKEQNTANTRIFSLGLGNDLNAVLLDQLAEQTRSLSSYVRPEQNVETRIAGFFDKIHHPVLAKLKLSVGEGDVRLAEIYPPQLPDLFHGDQLVVLARFEGSGPASIRLDGEVGPHQQQFDYAVDFQTRSDGKEFVEQLWARRKVGYLLDQIRIGGEQRELVDAVVELSKNYGITTPYTSYLIMPDVPLEVASAESFRGADGAKAGGRVNRYYAAPPALANGAEGDNQLKVEDFARRIQTGDGLLARTRGALQDEALDRVARADKSRPAGATSSPANEKSRDAAQEAKQLKSTLDQARFNYGNGRLVQNQAGQLGVDLSVSTNHLKCQNQLVASAVCPVASRNCVEIGGVWIDDAFTPQTRTLTIKAQSEAYFRILERQPQMKDVFRLGNHLVWIAPNGDALVIDSTDGREKISDREIDAMFASK